MRARANPSDPQVGSVKEFVQHVTSHVDTMLLSAAFLLMCGGLKYVLRARKMGCVLLMFVMQAGDGDGRGNGGGDEDPNGKASFKPQKNLRLLITGPCFGQVTKDTAALMHYH